MTIRDLPEETRLIQLAEEASELAQACLKMVRVMDGDTPLPEQYARDNLIEEMADVSVCMTALQDIAPLAQVGEIITQKAQRWEDRLNGKG
jgi:hypothetical protein